MSKQDLRNWGIHWFRRDLRLVGNAALKSNWIKSDKKVLGIFCFDSQFLNRADFSYNRFGFFLNTLAELKKELQAQGGDLLVLDQRPKPAFEALISFLKDHSIELPKTVSWNRDYEPFARARDAELEKVFHEQGIQVLTERDHLLIEPWEIKKSNSDDSFYQVYTPFAKKWFEALHSPEVQRRISINDKLEVYHEKNNETKNLFQLKWSQVLTSPSDLFQDQLQTFIEKNSKHVSINLPPAGSKKAFQDLKAFKQKLNTYQTHRDIPSLEGTSKMSLYQKNGSMVSSQIIYYLQLGQLQFAQKSESLQYLKEIAWREFFYAVMYHKPQNEHQAFIEKYQNIKWQNNEEWFQKWCLGQTGFPIVDAGMRELLKTGWMHNRVRMIVASFLVKDLLIDWRWGEKHFMQYLLDGDLAPNNGGWQWAASTGCDPQPYFRIFNPWLQSEKFDPEGLYIKTYVPELAKISSKLLHDPDADRSTYGYAKPIVDHQAQKPKALALFK